MFLMYQTLTTILEIQELDMKMIRLIRLRKERQSELDNIATLRTDLQEQLQEKTVEIEDLSKNIIIQENRILDTKEKIKKLEAKQSTIKKVDEFNALTQEMSSAERERLATEQLTSDLIDRRNLEEEVLEKLKSSLQTTEDNSEAVEIEIKSTIQKINAEGRELKIERDKLTDQADPEILKIYNRLLKNKKDRVVVPIENRTCSGCHIALTAQHENLVRKGERLIFCEHCSRILYWQESAALEGTAIATKKRRRKKTL
jgi:uncharacterized protein